MSTRSLTRVRWTAKSPVIICMYRHCDGYPSGHGLDLANWLNGATVGNGARNEPNYYNGVDHLAARMVAHFSNLHPNSNIYLAIPDEDGAEEYNYEVHLDANGNVCMTMSGHDESFGGSPAEFLAYLAAAESE